jgi:hypothetical protein
VRGGGLFEARGVVIVVAVRGVAERPRARARRETVATQDRVFLHYVPNSSIKHSKSDSKDRSQEIL